MRYSDFEGGVRCYHQREPGDRVYDGFCLQLQRVWPSAADSSEVIIEFLNKWGRMRLPKTRNMQVGLSRALETGRQFITQFRSLRFEETEMDHVLSICDERLRLRTAVVYLFEIFGSIGERFADVATTKTLHLLAPSFFVIWDNTTRDGVAQLFRSKAWTYALGFLPVVKRDVAELLADTQARFSASFGEAVVKLETLQEPKRTLAKRLDEYYFAVHKHGFVPRNGLR